MQQAARISQFTAFMYLGELVEFGATTKIFMNPEQEADPGLHHRPLRLIAPSLARGDDSMAEHIVSSYDAELAGSAPHASRRWAASPRRCWPTPSRPWCARDTALAQAVIAADPRLDALQREIEERAILTIARRQPMAIDLRETISAIRISGDLERIGDLAKNIAKRVLAISGQFQPQKIVAGVQHMSDLVLGAAQGRARRLRAAAGRRPRIDVWRRDGEIDALYTSLFRELLTYMMEDPRNIAFCTHLLFCAKNIERIGDHTTNIAETVHYLVTGENVADRAPEERSLELRRRSRPRPEIAWASRILIVEDEEPLTLLLRYNLEAEGYAVDSVARGDEAELRLREQRARPRAARLDAAGPVRHRALPAPPRAARDRAPADHHADGARRGGRPRPRPRDRRRRLHRQAVLGARAPGPRARAAAARRSPAHVAHLLAAGDIELDRETHRVRRGGRELHLGPTEFRLLEFLMQSPGRVFSREQLLDGVWGRDVYVDERTVDVHVGRLRKALNRAAPARSDPDRARRRLLLRRDLQGRIAAAGLIIPPSRSDTRPRDGPAAPSR